ncbi:MAG TPA: hypothetical protein VF581_12780 [Flavobacterium sp.]|jgi:NAD-dependent SIR2 family protein deacetylase
MRDKVVYILGAGFSMSSGAPSQGGLIAEILKLKTTYNGPSRVKVKKWIKQFEDFVSNGLCVSSDEIVNYALEDIYTPIDRSIADNISFRNYTPKRLVDLRDSFNRLIILAVRNAIENNKKPKTSLEKFARHIVKLGRERLIDEKADKVAVITTNWDIMLDNHTQRIINEEPNPLGQDFSGVVDYCCYISSLDKDDESIKPGLYAIGKGRYNIKILKLHGSLNWMQCPKCQRLYVKFFKHWSGGYIFAKKYCRHCENNFSSVKSDASILITNLIMPTFLKNLSNVQNKLIWQNAGIELSEASKIVFMGYSLPQADFEFKQLLSRMIPADTIIEAVLRESENPLKKETLKEKQQTAGYRYENFFSGRNIKVHYNGVEDYIDTNCT